MEENNKDRSLGNVIRIDDEQVRDHLGRMRVVGAFPDGQSALNLAAARLRHIAGTRWSTKRYMDMDLLTKNLELQIA